MNDEDVSSEARYLFSLLSSVLCETEPNDAPDGLNWRETFLLARRHGVANIVSYAVDRLKSSPPAKVVEAFLTERYRAIYQNELRTAEVDALFKSFDEQKIRYLPLKGYVLKTFYPSDDMRTMSDVDVLVDAQSTTQAREIMQSRGFKEIASSSDCHDVFVKPPFVAVELHRRLFDDKLFYSPFDNFHNIWTRTFRKSESSFEYAMNPDDSYLYLLEHIAKHYRSGGIQIRHLIDVWLFQKKEGVLLDRFRIQRELAKYRIERFAENLERLSAVWFDGVASTPILDELTSLILNGGGEKEVAVGKMLDFLPAKKLSFFEKARFFANRLFPPYSAMTAWAPSLRKVPWALPFYWFARNVRRLLQPSARRFFWEVLRMKKEDAVRLEDALKKSGFD